MGDHVQQLKDRVCKAVDRKSAEFADASAKAWEETLTFVRGHTPSPLAVGA